MYCYDEDDLVGRIAHTHRSKERNVIFLIGSAVSAPVFDFVGVPMADSMVEAIRGQFHDDPSSSEKLERELGAAGGLAYQTAFRFLIGRRGIDTANRLIKTSVLRALQPSVRNALGDVLPNDDQLKELEEQFDNWSINPALQALASLIVGAQDTFGTVALTSNFDPLLSIAIRRAGGHVMRTALHDDGNVGQTEGLGCHVVHFHGFWRHTDTLHTLQQLTQARPKLSASLRELLQDALVVPIGYGGWDDVFVRALVQAVGDEKATPEVLWCFRTSDSQSISEQYKQLIETLTPGISRGRVNFYAGIDCHLLLPRLCEVLGINQDIPRPPVPPGTVVVTDGTTDSSGRIVVSLSYKQILEESIPSVEDWEGRSTEIDELKDTKAAVVGISGMGGQGKSTLASYFAQNIASRTDELEGIEWRDCREEGHRINTAIAASILSLAPDQVSEEDLEARTPQELVTLLFRVLGQRRILFVFDNVDHYIGLKNGEPQGYLNLLVQQALLLPHRALFIFTSRPALNIVSSRFHAMPLTGIDRAAARRLFERKSTRITLAEWELDELLRVTQGHPLWISTIGGWTSKNLMSVREALGRVESGAGELPTKVLRSIWNTLNEKQQRLLRVLAEMERPESEDTVSEMVEGMTYNKFQQTLRVLRTLSLVQFRVLEAGQEVVDLHPLVRQFVRTEFPKRERTTFISKILSYVERRVTAYQLEKGATYPRSILEYGIQRVDLCINAGLIAKAVEVYVDLGPHLRRKGMAEQAVRLGSRILRELDWAAAATDYAKFDGFIEAVSKILVEADELDAADKCIKKYEECIPGNGAQFINLCDIQCYRYWFLGDFEHALHWGERGVELKERANADVTFDCKHNLALATRDAGHYDKALEMFLLGDKIEDVLKNEHLDSNRGGPYYGNIGRCLHLKGQLEDALKCYRKSARFVEDEERSTTINRGYIRYWVGQILSAQRRWEDAIYILIAAARIWKEVAPVRAASIIDEIDEAMGKLATPFDVSVVPDWKAENRFITWLNSSKN